MSQTETLRVPGEDAGARLDRFLSRVLSVKVEHARALIEQGRVRNPREDLLAAPQALRRRGRVVLRAAPRAGGAAADEPALPVLHDDADCLIVNKPAGLAVEPSRPGAPSALGAASRRGGFDVEGRAWPGLPHRLDRDTSGCLALARHDRALAALRAAFEAGSGGEDVSRAGEGRAARGGPARHALRARPGGPAPLHGALPEPAPCPALVSAARAAPGCGAAGGAAGDGAHPSDPRPARRGGVPGAGRRGLRGAGRGASAPGAARVAARAAGALGGGDRGGGAAPGGPVACARR